MTGTLYTGAAVTRFFGSLVIDLATMKLPAGSIPHLLQHGDAATPELGVIEKTSIVGGKLLVEGTLLDNDTARRVAENAAQGFPYQMSMGIEYGPRAEDFRFVPAGSSVQANGRTFDGPVYLARNTKLREASTVIVGADSATSHDILRN